MQQKFLQPRSVYLNLLNFWILIHHLHVYFIYLNPHIYKHFLAPTSDRYPREIDPDASKVFEACAVSPIKRDDSDFEPKEINFGSDIQMFEENAKTHDESIPCTPEKPPSRLAQGTPIPINSTYVLTTRMEVDVDNLVNDQV